MGANSTKTIRQGDQVLSCGEPGLAVWLYPAQTGPSARKLRYKSKKLYIKVPTADWFGKMSLFWGAPGIRFNDCVFTEPTHFAGWTPPGCAGLFVILAKDVRWSPKPFQPLYFGEFGNDEQQTHIGRPLLPPAARADVLFVATLALPFSTTAQRCALRNELVEAYNPVSQSEGARTSTRELARKLDAIEVRQHEQNTQIVTLLHQLNRIFEPQPVPPRRPIGFVARFADGNSAKATAADY
jgi:hypothetical protein